MIFPDFLIYTSVTNNYIIQPVSSTGVISSKLSPVFDYAS